MVFVRSRQRGDSPPAVGGHQKSLMRGRFCCYGFPTPGMRGSDLTRRIYAAVRLLELVGEGNWKACVSVATYLEFRLGKTKRGRRPKISARRDFLNKVDTVRALYNDAKRRHRWREKLHARDVELEHWWGLFLLAHHIRIPPGSICRVDGDFLHSLGLPFQSPSPSSIR